MFQEQQNQGRAVSARRLLSVVIIADQIDIDFETVQAPAAAPGSVPTTAAAAAASLKSRNAWTDFQPGSFLLQFGL